jgi:hypothetical protein
MAKIMTVSEVGNLSRNLVLENPPDPSEIK